MNTGWVSLMITVGILLVSAAFGLLYFMKKNPSAKNTPQPTAAKNEDTLASPLSGTVIPLEQVQDDVFSSGMLGSGLAILPESGELYAPADGVIANIPESRHAIALTADCGVELLMHIGIDTVNLKGEPFTLHVKEGNHVRKGQLLMTFDLATIKESGYDPVTPLILTGTDGWNFTDVKGQIRAGDVLMYLKKDREN